MSVRIITATEAIALGIPAHRIVACAEWSEESARLALRNSTYPETKAAAQSANRRLTMQAERLRAVAAYIASHEEYGADCL